MQSVLQVLETTYHCGCKDKDDPAFDIGCAMRSAGTELDVLLKGEAIRYAVAARCADRPHRGVQLLDQGARVFVIEDEAAAQGFDQSQLLRGVQTIPRSGVGRLYARYEHVWHW
jgi:hypothetical protein